MQLIYPKLLKRREDIDQLRGVELRLEDEEDVWHAKNLIAPGDEVKASTTRKAKIETDTGSTSKGPPETITLVIKVKKTEFDPGSPPSLRVAGTVVEENRAVSKDQHHTIVLKTNQKFTLKKNEWDSVAWETLSDALKEDKDGGTMAAIVMQEGIAHICLINNNRTILKRKVESNIPKKRSTRSEQDSGMRRFFESTLTNLSNCIEFSIAKPRPLLLASPGFVAADFKKYIADEGARLGDKKMITMAKNATVVHSSSGFLHSLTEILRSPEVMATMKDMRFAKEVRLMDELTRRLRQDDGRAWYGIAPVEKAVLEGAVGKGGGVLLVNNSLFRNHDEATRKRYVTLVDKVRADGGEARILSSDHESGEQLDIFGGIAAILTYPIWDLDQDEELDDGDGDAEAEAMVI